MADLPKRLADVRRATLPNVRTLTHDDRRETAAQRGYGHAWRKARAAYLHSHPLCRTCEAEGRIVEATVVDHIIPHRGNYQLFWDRSNWQPLCAACHNRKTAAQDGAFGNTVSRGSTQEAPPPGGGGVGS